MYSGNKIVRALNLIAVFSLVILLPRARAVNPPPDGGYPGGNTAEGAKALFSLTTGLRNTATGKCALYDNTAGSYNTANGAFALSLNTGDNNTAVGDSALFFTTTGNENTANGSSALYDNRTGSFNTAIGVSALYFNNAGNYNTATGWKALFSNTGSQNTATGYQALLNNITGSNDTSVGFDALFSNTTGESNSANGAYALSQNTTGRYNTAHGAVALANNVTGESNTALGYVALGSIVTGSNNIALGAYAGNDLQTGSNNIDIGNAGMADDAGVIRIGTTGTQTATFIAGIREAGLAQGVALAVGVTADGQLGVRTSSARFKEAIKPMDKVSEAIFSLQPVTFRYKKALDPAATPQFGLVAEEVAKVSPDLVARDAEGKPYTVRYEEVNAMLLNEFLKEHRKVEEQAEINQRQEATIARLEAALKEQAAQIQKVSNEIEFIKPAPRVVTNQ